MYIKDKVCIVTGANSGIGKITTLELAKMGARLIMVCRNQERGNAALREIKDISGSNSVELMIADFSSLESIELFVKNFKKKYKGLHLLVNNAGVYLKKYSENDEGIEMTMAINHFGYFRLTNRLLGLLKKSTPSRVVNVASEAHKMVKEPFYTFPSAEGYKGMQAYSESKLANILFTRKLAKKLKGTGVTANCLHPGFVKTNIFKGIKNSVLKGLFKIINALTAVSPEKGAETSIYLATSPEVEGISGKYFSGKKETAPTLLAQDEKFADWLWEESKKRS